MELVGRTIEDAFEDALEEPISDVNASAGPREYRP
jgi:hypothetical protein